jgi:hypothetical protein
MGATNCSGYILIQNLRFQIQDYKIPAQTYQLLTKPIFIYFSSLFNFVPIAIGMNVEFLNLEKS